MKISVLSSVCEQVPKGSLVWIALDVIRATTSMVTFLAEGGRSILVPILLSLLLARRQRIHLSFLLEKEWNENWRFRFDNSPVTLARHADRIRTAKAVM